MNFSPEAGKVHESIMTLFYCIFKTGLVLQKEHGDCHRLSEGYLGRDSQHCMNKESTQHSLIMTAPDLRLLSRERGD